MTVPRFEPGNSKLNDFAWIYALYELGQTAATGVDALKVQQDILDHIVFGLEAESGSIALLVEGTEDVLEIVAGTDLPPGTVGSRLPPGVGVFGHVLATGQPLLINGGAAETGLSLLLRERRDRPTHSAMCWPLRVHERTIGALAVNRAAGLPRYTVADLDRGQVLTSLLALVMANHRMHVERENRILELSTLNATMQRMNALLEDAQNQVIQSEKLASIGQIAAGVAHEINNPVAFVLSNLGTLESYLSRLFEVLEAYVEAAQAAAPLPAPLARARALREDTAVDFLRDDGIALLSESRDGLLRVKRIVEDLKDFARGGAEEAWESADLHAALDSTINIVRSEIKYKARIETRYGNLPQVECLPSRLNQVFLNLLVNAGQAIDANGTITISSGVEGPEVWIRFEDTGCGIPKEHLNRIFEPFFTTKPVGQGTGLGLSVSYSIVRKHGGRIEVESDVGRGTRFTVHLPLRQTEAETAPTLDRVTVDAAYHPIQQELSKLPAVILSMYPEDQYAARAFKAGAAGCPTNMATADQLVDASGQVTRGRKDITPVLAHSLAESIHKNQEVPAYERLSHREFQTLRMIASGRTLAQIGDALALSPKTVSVYRTRVLKKLQMRSNAELTRYALQHSLVE